MFFKKPSSGLKSPPSLSGVNTGDGAAYENLTNPAPGAEGAAVYPVTSPDSSSPSSERNAPPADTKEVSQVVAVELLREKNFQLAAATECLGRAGLIVNQQVQHDLKQVFSVYPDWRQCAIANVLANFHSLGYFEPSKKLSDEMYRCLVDPFLKHDPYLIANVNSIVGVLVLLRGIDCKFKSDKAFGELLFSHGYFLRHAMHLIAKDLLSTLCGDPSEAGFFYTDITRNRNFSSGVWDKFFEFVLKDPDNCIKIAKKMIDEQKFQAMTQPVFKRKDNLKVLFDTLSHLKSDFLAMLNIELCDVENRCKVKNPAKQDFDTHARLVRLMRFTNEAGSIGDLRLVKLKHLYTEELMRIRDSQLLGVGKEGYVSLTMELVMQVGSLGEMRSLKVAFELENNINFNPSP